MVKEQIIAQAAESIIIKQDDRIIKRRIAKGYRIPEIDERLRKRRTRSEAKIIEKLKDKINVPKIINVDENKKEIIMEFIDGKKLSDYLDSLKLEKQQEICKQIGQEVGKMHQSDIIHGDLTTSNMILKDEKVFLIDFGLSFISIKIEDKAVDIHLFRQALESKHFQHWQDLYSSFLEGYNPQDKSNILKQLEKVEMRGRYKH